ncbi:MAG: Nudix family hydrolase [Nevskia sp.]|nr:Nudix family hydrolase [Nevskia sp.]
MSSDDARPVIHVACGVLIRASGEVLLAQRPLGKLAAGKWEFPGGKIERGETPYQALLRELDEELGVQVRSARRLAHLRQDYSDRLVWLDTWLVDGFDGAPQSREGQGLAWTAPPRIAEFDVLPSCWRVAAALQLPREYVFTPPQARPHAVLQGLAQLPSQCLLRLRLPGLDDAAYAELAKQLIAAARARCIGVVLDRDPAQVQALGAAGWHATVQRLDELRQRPLPQGRWFLASAHDATEIAAAHALGADAVVVGPVRATTTHPDAVPLGWDGFAALANRAGLPVYALGGVGRADQLPAQRHGAFGIAAISAYWP